MIRADDADDELLRFIERVRSESPADAGVAAELASVLARSGESLAPASEAAVDVASTGGPSSLTTLLCPLYLRVAGCLVPKLGVPGRPAGGVDCLAQLPGYRTVLSGEELREVLEAAGYAHFEAAGRFAPFDARLFRLRQRHGAQAVPTLVCASLVAKKIAVGVRRAGLDVRVGEHGNFGRSWEEAQANARLFRETARRHGIEAVPVITDGRFPYQPFIGRREALVAVRQALSGTPSDWLGEHLYLCRTLALASLPRERRAAAETATRTALRAAFDANAVAQGTNASALDEVAERTLAAHVRTVAARAEGFLQQSLSGVRDAIVSIQRRAPEGGPHPDPTGVILMRRPGDWVAAGEPVATIRADSWVTDEDVAALADAVSTTCELPSGPTFRAEPPP